MSTSKLYFDYVHIAFSHYDVDALVKAWYDSYYLGQTGLLLRTLITQQLPDLAQHYQINVGFREFVARYDAKVYTESCDMSPERCLYFFASQGNLRGVKIAVNKIKKKWSEKGKKDQILGLGLAKAIKAKHQKIIAFLLRENPYPGKEVLAAAARNGDWKLVNYAVEHGAKKWNVGLYKAAEGDHKDLIAFFIDQGADDWNRGLRGAARGGHKYLVQFFLSEVPLFPDTAISENKTISRKQVDDWDWDAAIYGAAYGGHCELVDFLVAKAETDGKINQVDWDWPLYGAAKNGSRVLVKLFIARGATDWEWALEGAARKGHKELVKFFIDKGAHDWDRGLRAAARGGQSELVTFFAGEGALLSEEKSLRLPVGAAATDWQGALEEAACGGHKELVLFFIRKGAVPDEATKEDFNL